MKILNPNTQKEVSVISWSIIPKEIIAELKKGMTARGLSLKLLSTKKLERKMLREEGGDSAESNFGLRVFEQGLDFVLGCSVLGFMNSCYKRAKKLPKPFELCLTRKGEVFAKFPTGQIYHIGG